LYGYGYSELTYPVNDQISSSEHISGWISLLNIISRDVILGHQFDKNLKSFAPCYSYSFYHNHTLLWFNNSYQKIRETENSSLIL
jgi:hypothetical protein